MTEPDDTRLEHELRDALDRRDPGPAPLTLRERVLRVPNEPPTRADKGRGAIQAVLGLAAVVALMVVAVGVSGRPGLGLQAANEQDAVNEALANCVKRDTDCHVIAIGPFSVGPN